MLLPKLNKRFGTAVVWCSSELFFHLLMMATYACHGNGSVEVDASSGGSSRASVGGDASDDGTVKALAYCLLIREDMDQH